MEWSLHPQLAKLTTVVGDLALSRVLLENDSSYPWLILVPRMPGISEIIDLDPNEQVQLLGEIDAASRALKSVATFEKLNIADFATVDLPNQAGTPRIDYLGEINTGYGNRPYKASTGFVRLLYLF